MAQSQINVRLDSRKLETLELLCSLTAGVWAT